MCTFQFLSRFEHETARRKRQCGAPFQEILDRPAGELIAPSAGKTRIGVTAQECLYVRTGPEQGRVEILILGVLADPGRNQCHRRSEILA